MKFSKNKKKTIILILVTILLLPSFIIAFSSIALATDDNANDSWIKGIIFLLLSYIINRFVSDSDSEQEEKEDEKKPPVIEKEKEYEVLGFYVNWITKDSSSQLATENNLKNIDMVAPFWYTVNTDGSLEQRYEGHQYELANLNKEDENFKLLPLINNSQINNMVLVDKETRKKAVNNIVKLVNDYNYSGVNIDFEFIPEWTRQGYTEFIKLLSKNLNEDKLLTISVFPKIDVPASLQGAFDYAKLANYADRIVIMSYDHHWSTSEAGPIAPVNWVEKNIQYALEYIPAEKILLGIANYGYDWAENGKTRDLTEKEAVKTAEKYNSEIKWNNRYQTPYFNYNDQNGVKHEVWFENSQSNSYKFNLVKKYDLKGIAIWKLGNSPTKFWDLIANEFKKD
ncbi:MAG: glycosyl hydrolase family 18 protein [Bacillota bacterium]